MVLFGSFFLALLIGVVLIPPLVNLSSNLKLVDVPDARHRHEAPVPRVGGIAIVIATIVPMLIWYAGDRTGLGVVDVPGQGARQLEHGGTVCIKLLHDPQLRAPVEVPKGVSTREKAIGGLITAFQRLETAWGAVKRLRRRTW